MLDRQTYHITTVEQDGNYAGEELGWVHISRGHRTLHLPYGDTQRAALVAEMLSAMPTLDPAGCRQRLSPFGGACYNDNTPEELLDALLQDTADATDCATWGLTTAEWRAGVQGALEALLADAVEEAFSE